MPDDDRVDALDGLQGLRGVLAGLALGDAGALGREVDHVGGEALLGGLEVVGLAAVSARSSTLDGPAARVGSFLMGRSATRAISSVVLQDLDGVVAGGEVGGRDEVTHHRGFSPWWEAWRACGGTGVCPGPGGEAGPARRRAGAEQTVSRPASSASCTLTVSRSATREVLADVVGADRKFVVAAVDEDRELDGARVADVAEGVEGGARHGASGEEHVVDEDDEAAVDAVTGDLGAADGVGRLQPQVVPVHGDVEGTDRDLGAGDRFELLGEPAGEEDATGGDAEEDHVVGALGALDDLVGDAGEDPRRAYVSGQRSTITSWPPSSLSTMPFLRSLEATVAESPG
ncbi:hypothetical protein STANM309S_04807 [Streptomyces tanashiensis]